jgi:hypothetical protein
MTVERFDADCRNARAAMRTLREVAEEPVDYGEPDMVEEHEHLFCCNGSLSNGSLSGRYRWRSTSTCSTRRCTR